jgi:hypothetical protein
VSVLGRFEKQLDDRAWMQDSAAEDTAGPRAPEHIRELANALATTGRLRAFLEDGFADRDRGFEYVLARLPNASPDRERAERAEAALAERTLQLAEALFAASASGDVFADGLADRDLRFAAVESLWEKRLRAETQRHEALRDEIRHIEDRLEERSAQLAEALIATDGVRATVRDVLRVSGEALALVLARLEAERGAAMKPPNVARRVARALKRAVPSPFARIARAARRRVSRR